MKSRLLTAAGLLLVAGGVGLLLWITSPRRAIPRPSSRTPDLGTPELIPSRALGIREASGIVDHRGLDRLYVVGDRGVILELDASARPLRKAVVGGDLEDVTVHTGSGDLLLLAEDESEILRFDPKAFVVTSRCSLDGKALLGDGRDRARDGFEGLEWRPSGETVGGMLLLAHQRDPAAIVSLRFDAARCGAEPLGRHGVERRRKYQKCGSLTAITFAASLDRLLALDGERRDLLVLGPGGKVEHRWLLPCVQPEGLCLDSRGTLWIADDRQGLWRFSDALPHLRSLLAADGPSTAATSRFASPGTLSTPEGNVEQVEVPR